MCVCVYACVYVFERERERAKEVLIEGVIDGWLAVKQRHLTLANAHHMKTPNTLDLARAQYLHIYIRVYTYVLTFIGVCLDFYKCLIIMTLFTDSRWTTTN